MAKFVNIEVDGQKLLVDPAHCLLAVIWNSGLRSCGLAPNQSTRLGLCGMGICFECEVKIEGLGHRRACMTYGREGLVVTTHG